MSADKTIYLIDGHYFIFRAYYALPELESPAGEPVGAVYGFAQTLIKLVTDLAPKYGAVAFDQDPILSFRTTIYPEYKANRGEPPDDLRPQFGRCIQVARALGMASFVVDGYEADDILATLVRRFGRPGRRIEVLTPDKDVCQVVKPGVVLRSLSGESVDVAAVRERFGVPPSKVADYQALVGDPIDNVPGVPGIGPKTARKLLASAQGVTELLDRPQRVRDARLRERLQAYESQLRLSLELTRLREDVPIEPRLADLRYRGALPRARALFRRLGLRRLLDRVPKWCDGV